MKRFNFRLQTLLDIKMRREEDLKRELSRTNGRILRALQRAEQGREAFAGFQASEKLRREASPTAGSLRLSVAYRYRLQRDIAEAEGHIETLRQEAQTTLHSLTEAKKQRRTLELLREKKLSLWKLDYKREEQETIDDVSQKEYIRKKKHAAAPAG